MFIHWILRGVLKCTDASVNLYGDFREYNLLKTCSGSYNLHYSS